MVTRPALLQQVRDRLLRQKRLNALGFFIPLAVSSWVFGLLVLRLFSFPQLLSFLPPLICCGFLGVALWKARAAVGLETVATLIDDKVGGKDRFLTLISAPQEITEEAFYSVIQRQTERLAGSFRLKYDLPFSFDKRIFFSVCGALFSLLLFLLLSHFERVPPFFAPVFWDGSIGQSQREAQDKAIKTLEEVAHRLLQHTSTPQEQMIGAQLSSLAQQLKDPTLSLQEKQQLIEEARKRLNLDIPFPQLLPFDLELFASKGRDGQDKGSEKDSAQKGNMSSANTEDKEGQSKSTSATATGNELQQNAKQDGEKNNQPQPRQEGGGITFDFPQDQKNNQERSPHDASGVGQQPAREQTKAGPSPGTDPTRPGGGQNDQAQNQKTQKGDAEGTREAQNKRSEGEVTIGQGRGERFLKPGEQPGGGFLTQDAHFVKVRVPIGQDAQANEGTRTANNSRAVPKTSYSNAPLKESAPEQTQGKQPIPLEYRAILKDNASDIF
jgi:hypothetical protein